MSELHSLNSHTFVDEQARAEIKKLKNLNMGAPTDEQVSGAVKEWLDDHPEATTTVADGSIGWAKLAQEVLENQTARTYITDLTYSNIYAANPGYFGGQGSMGTQFIDIGNHKKLYANSTATTFAWAAYKIGDVITYISADSTVNSEAWLRYPSSLKDVEIDLDEFRALGATNIAVGFKGIEADFDATAVTLCFVDYEPKTGFEQYGIIAPLPKLIHTGYSKNTGYSGADFDHYGANKTVYKGNTHDGYIDVTENKTIYIKAWNSNAVFTNQIGFGCFDADKNFLYTSAAEGSNVLRTLLSYVDIKSHGITAANGGAVQASCIYKFDFPEEVKYISLVDKIHSSAGYAYIDELSGFVAGYQPITDHFITDEEYRNRPSEDMIKVFDMFASQDTSEAITGVFIGDSLTNWGGGSDSEGFLKIVHDKTGMMTTNRGLAGAHWQTSEGQTQSGVHRVNAIVEAGEKFDLYCFILGTNAGSNTDTGETSADTSTMCGAIRYCLETLKAYDPTAYILVCLPPQRAEGNENQEKVNAVIKTIAESYSVRTLDLFHGSGIVPNTKIADVGYLSDGLHLGDNGKDVLGKALAAEIKYMMCL